MKFRTIFAVTPKSTINNQQKHHDNMALSLAIASRNFPPGMSFQLLECYRSSAEAAQRIVSWAWKSPVLRGRSR